MYRDNINLKEKFNDFYTPSKMNLLSALYAKEKERNQNREFYYNYMNIIEKFAILLRKLNVTDSITASAYFQYLLWDGYFSKDKRLEYSISGRSSYVGAMGADIMTGRSVCENNSEMLRDILNKMNFDAYIMGCVLDSEPLGESYRPKIYCRRNEDITIGDSIFYRIATAFSIYRIGNHMVTLFKHNDSYYISDSTNLVFFNFEEVLKAKVVGGSGTIRIKPWVSLVFDKMSNQEFLKVMNGTFDATKKVKIGVEQVRTACCRMESTRYCDSYLIDSFYSDIKSDIDEVCKKLSKKI